MVCTDDLLFSAVDCTAVCDDADVSDQPAKVVPFPARPFEFGLQEGVWDVLFFGDAREDDEEEEEEDDELEYFDDEEEEDDELDDEDEFEEDEFDDEEEEDDEEEDEDF